jgi:hypothetical protein
VLELHMRASLPHPVPAIRLQATNDFPAVHV